MNKSILIVALIGVITLNFQNCSPARFGMKSSKLVALNDSSSVDIDPPVEELPPIVDDTGNEDNSSNEERFYVCVLAGEPGKSFKIALQEELDGKIATPKDVCMSKSACTDIISQAFDVLEPAYRGFCPEKNPHVAHLSDVAIQTLIDELIP
jgi:hypothetical protein